jgi:phosphoglycolate phosphatase-like HAD superfamily hydrolase
MTQASETPEPATFQEWLRFHMTKGTRPDGDGVKRGKIWEEKELAEKVSCTKRVLRYWLDPKKRVIPKVHFPKLSDAFFGSNELPIYQTWRNKFREARDTAILANTMQSRETKPTSALSTKNTAERNREPIDEFIGNLRDVRMINVIAITGKSTISHLVAALARHPKAFKNDIEWRVLLRSPFSADTNRDVDRAKTIERMRAFVKANRNFNLTVRYYSSAFPLAGIICEHPSDKFSGYLTSYDWLGPNERETASANAERVYNRRLDHEDNGENEDKGASLLAMYRSWFEHFWGKHTLHTIMVDFDDTIAITMPAQVEGWAEAITQCVKSKLIKPSDLRGRLGPVARSENQRERLKYLVQRTFLNMQEEPNILQAIFRKTLPDNQLNFFRRCRVKKRNEQTLKFAKPIVPVVNDLVALSKDYQIVVVSATIETLIEKVLAQTELKVPFIIGNKAAKHEWERSIETNAQQFIRVSNMLGVPLDRMVFIGDSNADFRAATQLGIHFIENRHNAILHQIPGGSRIKNASAVKYHISGTDDGELLTAIGKIENEIRWK